MKKEFRKKVIEKRKSLDQYLITEKSSLITEKLLSMDCVKNSDNIMLYLDFNNEVQTDDIINKLLSIKKNVYAPVTITKDRKLIPYKIANLNASINIGAFGIREPKPSGSTPIPIKELDMVIVPAVAYDVNGYRLGYGGGFYDRFLKKLKKDAITIGIAFDLQIFQCIPKEKHDAQLDYIVTESKIISIKRSI